VSELLILVVDDEAAQRQVLAGFLKRRGYEVAQAASLSDALGVVSSRTVDLVLSDLRMPGGSGIELISGVRQINPDIPVVIMTAFGTVQSAVEAMRHGAVDYLTKPIDLDELQLTVARELDRRALVSENRELRRLVESRYSLKGLETANSRMEQAVNLAARAASSRAAILLRGETGTGKELLARAIHRASPRAQMPLVTVNIGALPDTLIESEMFGHERGAFTGADRERRGRIEEADGGTLFLDEIGDLPRGAQVKMLRVLQEQTFERLGSNRPIRVDVRIIAATHRPLEQMMAGGEFRDDLYYRLNVVSIELPALRERREDIPGLVEQFLERHGTESAGRVTGVSREALDLLTKYAYPGNVRELENIVRRALVLARGPLVGSYDLPPHVRGLAAEPEATGGSFTEQVARFERRLIADALAHAGGVQTRAARELGMSERHLRSRLRRLGISEASRKPTE